MPSFFMHVQNLVVKNANKNVVNIQDGNRSNENSIKEEGGSTRKLNNEEKPVEYETW